MGLQPLQGVKTRATHVHYRVNIVCEKPEGADEELSPKLKEAFGEKTTVGSAFTFTLPVTSELLPHELRQEIYDGLSEREASIVERFGGASAQAAE